ncbi:hypothetical protein QE450_003602 [Paenibacillus sp. SORGH_AS306]|uniref:contact-dependent growth inhibition system immunity protein n=1 Tax=unclassified Paenibacillus TaxID=185978 RepID=UPI00277FC4A9|nr:MULTISPECIES: contact-dependent growth inhibition system immunity protein [unclassified Paenibacillus]MDQ1236104.1 hypothetical protein [Paenibacillus sp. SORGH_AS_0306]MDR6108459.1 hypothetical protein [Paenibacillus sp. SORGH_AS_0338]
MISNVSQLTINEIGILEGFKELHKVDKRIPLSIWFETILATKLKDLSNGDLAKMIRQKIYIKSVTPEALKRLKVNPIAGYLGDGGLLESLVSVENDVWKGAPEIAYTLLIFLEEFMAFFHANQLTFPEDEERFSNEDREEYFQNLLSIKKHIWR